jgi:hypothetical protein
MHSIRRTPYFKRSHAVLALLFLAVMLVEWGSHSLAFAHSSSPSGMIAVGAPEPEHDDPCRTMADCCQSRKHGGTVMSPSHHLPSFNSFVEMIQFTPAYSREFAAELEPAENVRRIHRPKDPLLHPPELS